MQKTNQPETVRDRIDIMHEIAEAEQHLFANVVTRPGQILRPGTQPAQVNRKDFPVCTGVLDYFPDALIEVARVSRVGSEQQNPGEVMHWDRSKSADDADSLVRHLIRRGTRDKDRQRHMAKAAWRALALLQKEIEMDKQQGRI